MDIKEANLPVLSIGALKPNLFDEYDNTVPHITKYMGSKRNILDFIIKSIDQTYYEGKLCDLFAGTSVLSGALGKLIPMHSNDIQEYSSILAKTYLSNYDWTKYEPDILDIVIEKAKTYITNVKGRFPQLSFCYSAKMPMIEFTDLERRQQNLIDFDFGNLTHHLFIKNYSGTYWSYDQCLWIDGLRKVAEDYKETPIYNVILSSLMFAMSYNSQSTGHYAQYRDAKNLSSKEDILIYRRKEILPYFKSKFKQLQNFLGENPLCHSITTLDYNECLDVIAPHSLVYADPPYAFVHYSRFYHALETLVKYDYPKVNYKGRYRIDRHQSPFCKTTEVKLAFNSMFSKINDRNSILILSYSNTGMITLNEILDIAHGSFDNHYRIEIENIDHIHSTMGRKDDKSKLVDEYLIIAKRK